MCASEPGREPVIRIDLHVHTAYSADATIAPVDLLAMMDRRHIDLVAITDHDAIEGALELREAAPERIVVGEEIRTREGEIIGLLLEERVPPGLGPEETIGRIRSQGGIVYLPHPADRLRRSTLAREAVERVLPQVDVVEVLNSRVLDPADNRRAQRMTVENGLLAGAGSDAHIPAEIGRAYVEMPGFCDAASFLRSLGAATICGRTSSPLVHAASTWARLTRPWRPRPGQLCDTPEKR
jgi:predicted metal-dependent phosphoesterase TrpH